MSSFKRILLVALLTIFMVAAGVAWERFYVTPLVDRTEQKASRDAAEDGLSTACIEELASMGQPSSATTPQANRSLAEANASRSEQSAIAGGHLFGPDGSSNHMATNIQVDDDPSPPAMLAKDASARPIQQTQSAGWVEPVNSLHPAKASPPASLAGSAHDSALQNNARETLKSVDPLDLMRRLRGDDGDQRTEARHELVRRGFSEVDLELARQLFSPEVETRVQLARSVPRLSSVDAAQWLWWLAQDPQPQVRLVAVSTLATTGDPALLDRVEALARDDHDPQVHALADQISKQRELSSKQGDSIER